MEQYTPSPALRTSEADLSGRSNERKRCFRLENIRRYFKRTDKTYLLLCIFSSTMAVLALASWAAKQGNGFATDAVTGQITGIGDYRRALVQAGAAGIGLVIALLLSCIDYRSLVKVWPVHVVLTWGLVLPTLFIRNVSVGPLTIGYNAGDTDNYSWYKLGGFTFQPTELAKISFILTFAMHLNNVRSRINEPKELVKLLLHLAVPILIIHIQGEDVTAIIDGSQLSDGAKRRALAIFTALAAAEAKAHGKTPETVMFHEVGAVDSIVDVCSVAICLDNRGIEDIVVESLSEGHGTIRCAHGLMPIPVPAVVNLCQAGNIALTPAPVAGELVTPTGAAIVTALRTSDQLPSRYRIEAVGYGAGKRPYEGCSGTLRCLLVHVDA